MKKRPPAPAKNSDLRLRAVKQLPVRPDRGKGTHRADVQRLVQELQIHRIELELQNEELLQAKVEVEAGLAKYTDLYDFAPVGYFTLSPTGTIQMVNLTGSSLAGVERARLVGRGFDQLLSAESRGTFPAFLREVFATPVKRSGEFEFRGRGLPPGWVSIEAQCLPSGLGCRMLVVDITSRKNAENQLRNSEVRYRRLFEAAHDGVLLLDPGTRKITDANPFMTKLLGYPTSQIVGRELWEIGLLSDQAASRLMFEELKKTRHVRYVNLPLKNQTGAHQEVEVVANLYAESGHPVIQCNVRDITVRKRAEEVLRRNEALFSTLIEEAPVGVYVVDAEFRLQKVNSRAQHVFAPVYPLIGRDFAEVHRLLWARRVSDPIVALFRRTLETGEPYQSPGFSERRRDTGREEIYDWQIQRVTLPAGEFGVVAFFTDITERKRAEEVQRRLDVLTASNEKLCREIIRRQTVEEALRESERRAHALLAESRLLQEKLRHVSHQILQGQEQERKRISRELHDDISQLLVGIIVHLSNFTKAAEVRPEGIRESIEPLSLLVEKSVRTIHRFARELRPSMLDDLGLVAALEHYVSDVPKRVGRVIELKCTGDFSALENDRRTVLYRVAQEALVNVGKHAHATRVRVKLTQARGVARLEIADNGRAFDVAKLASARWGHRLGLLGMRERVEMFGGNLSVVSAPKKGTTIRATLPFAPVTA